MGTIASRAQEAAEASTDVTRLRSLASDRSPQVRRQVAANPNTPADVAANLASDRDWRTRAAVATRADVPADVLVSLVEDRVWQVRFTLAENKHASPTVWEAITRAPDTDVRMVLAQQTWLSVDVAMQLARDTAKDVRQGLAATTTHPEVFAVLTDDAHQDVRAAALDNLTLVTADHLAAASRDSSPVVRSRAASSPALAPEDRQRLMKDRSRFVRDSIEMALAAPALPETLDLELPEIDLTNPQTLANWPVTPRKPSTKWFMAYPHLRPASDDIPEEILHYWKLAAAIDADPAWIAWWSHTDAARLELVGAGHLGGRVEIQERGDIVWALTDGRLRNWSAVEVAREVQDVLGVVAETLHLPPPPPLPDRVGGRAASA